MEHAACHREMYWIQRARYERAAKSTLLSRSDSKIRRRIRQRATVAMVVADHARDLPHPARILPEHRETCDAAAVGTGPQLRIAEQMNAGFDGAVLIQRINAERSRDEIAMNLAADIGFQRIERALLSAAEARYVVIELQIVGEQRTDRLQITVVVGVEKDRIESGDGLKQIIGFLCIGSRYKQHKNQKAHMRSNGVGGSNVHGIVTAR